MATKLIELEDKTLVEVEVPEGRAEQISEGMVEKVNSTLAKIYPILTNICKPIKAVWDDLGKDSSIESTEIELGLSFEGEGNIYITKAKSGANLTIKIILKPRSTNGLQE